jgi:hypothetical protein
MIGDTPARGLYCNTITVLYCKGSYYVLVSWGSWWAKFGMCCSRLCAETEGKAPEVIIDHRKLER